MQTHDRAAAPSAEGPAAIREESMGLESQRPIPKKNIHPAGRHALVRIVSCTRRPLIPKTSRGLSLRPVRHPASHKSPGTTPENETGTRRDPTVRCRQCGHPVTTIAQRKIIDNAHVHTFANPSGIIFEIACFGEAAGCGYAGSTSSEFTWFAGYRWRIAVCAGCLIHLGWRFAAADGHFFHGLITSRLRLPGG